MYVHILNIPRTLDTMIKYKVERMYLKKIYIYIYTFIAFLNKFLWLEFGSIFVGDF